MVLEWVNPVLPYFRLFVFFFHLFSSRICILVLFVGFLFRLLVSCFFLCSSWREVTISTQTFLKIHLVLLHISLKNFRNGVDQFATWWRELSCLEQGNETHASFKEKTQSLLVVVFPFLNLVHLFMKSRKGATWQ